MSRRLVGCVHMRPGPLDHWERHPPGDEFLLLREHRAGRSFGRREIPLKTGEAVVVPKGVWHTFIVHDAGDLLFATAGEHTEHRASDG